MRSDYLRSDMFYSFIISRRSDNIRLMLTSSGRGVFICSFAYSFLESRVGFEMYL